MKYPDGNFLLKSGFKLQLVAHYKWKLDIVINDPIKLRSPNFCYSRTIARNYNKLALF